MSGGLMSGGRMSGGLMSGGLMSGGLTSGGLMSAHPLIQLSTTICTQIYIDRIKSRPVFLELCTRYTHRIDCQSECDMRFECRCPAII